MPFKSKAQRRKFAELLVQGQITPEQFEEWNRETGSARLPERVSKKAPARKPGSKRRSPRKRKQAARKSPGKTTPARKSAARKPRTKPAAKR